MIVAITYESGFVFPHFGRTPAFKVYEIQDGKVAHSAVIETNGTGHGALAGFLSDLGAEVLICGGIGGGAVNAMASAGIKVYGGAEGDVDAVMARFLAGTLPQNGDATCDHHHEDHDHHGCGHGGCHD